jgi:hypothetical protein
MSPFFANKGYHPISLPNQPMIKDDTSPTANNLVNSFSQIHQNLSKNIESALIQQAKYYNNRHLPNPNYDVGSRVWLSRNFIKTTRPSTKLDHVKLGPFKILERIGRSAYKLELPTKMKIHPIFHVSLLEPVYENSIPRRTQSPPPPIKINQEYEHEVEQIIDSRIKYKKIQYLIDWKGYDQSHRTWEPEENLSNSQRLIKEFHLKYPNKPKPHRVRL